VVRTGVLRARRREESAMADEVWVDLATAIGQIREQLATARADAVGSDVLFTVGKVEVELGVEATRESGGGMGLNFGVVTWEGKGAGTSTSTHKVCLELLPHDTVGGSIDVEGQVPVLPER
jgi:hypothetical protein